MSVKTDVVSVVISPDSNVIEIRVSGKLSKEDYDVFVPEIENQIAQHGTVRILFDMHDFHGWETAAIWEDIKFGWRHFHDIERITMIGEAAWEKGMTTFCLPFTKADIRYFDRKEEIVAREWIVEEK